jgi:replicative DNA helicase
MNLDNRLPPQDIDAEESVLSALFMSNDGFEDIDSLKPDDFYKSANKIIFKSMLDLKKKKEPIDLVTIASRLKEKEELESIGGAAYLAQISDAAPVAVNIKHYGKIIQDLSVVRKLINKASGIIEQGFKVSNVEDYINQAQKSILEIQTTSSQDQIWDMETLMLDAVDRIEKAQSQEIEMGLRFGLPTLDDYTNMYGSKLFLIAARPGMGKELTLCSDVLLYNGTFKKMGDVMVGDKVASIDGKESKVVGVFPQGIKPVYEIEFSDGRCVKAGLEHQWEVMYREWDKPRVLTTKQLIRKLKYKRYRKRIYIPNHTGDFGIDNNILVHPYLLGVLLGDGGLTSGIKLTTSYEHILEKIKPMLLGANLKLDQKITYRIVTPRGQSNQLLENIDNLGLRGKRSYEKFIPKQYLSATKESRLELIRGLIDTDGTVEKNGSMTYSTSSKQLALDFQKLARSLGAYASLKSRLPYFKYKGIKKVGRVLYNIYISFKGYDSFVTIPHKKKRVVKKKFTRRLNIESIVHAGDYKCQCISVDHQKALYLTNNYITTHNTALALSIAKHLATRGVKVGFLSIEMDKESLSDRLISIESNVNSLCFYAKESLSDESMSAITNSADFLSTLPIYIDDADCTIQDVERKCRKFKKMGCEIIFIDQLSKIRGDSKKSKFEVYTDNCAAIALLKKELRMPIGLLCQLNRNVEMRTNKTPEMSDLKQTGMLEEDADLIFFIFRPGYYDENIDESQTKIILAKNRQGAKGTEEKVLFNKKRGMFELQEI